MSKSASSSSKGGIGVLGVVQILFIILKCTKTGPVGTWHWWKVMLPLICTVGLVCFCGCLACCGFITTHICCIVKPNKQQNKVEIDIENPHKPQVVASTCNNSTTYRVI